MPEQAISLVVGGLITLLVISGAAIILLNRRRGMSSRTRTMWSLVGWGLIVIIAVAIMWISDGQTQP